jgi:hypothetical protein
MSITEILCEPTQEDLQWAYREGYYAFQEKFSKSEWPDYGSEQEIDEWIRGWEAACWDK